MAGRRQPGPPAGHSLHAWCRERAAHLAVVLAHGGEADAPWADAPWIDDPGFAVADLPADLSRAGQSPARTDRCQTRISWQLTAGLAALAEHMEMPVSVVLLAAWQVLIHRHGGQGLQIVGTILDSDEASGAPRVLRAAARLDGARTVHHVLTEVGLGLLHAYRQDGQDGQDGQDAGRDRAQPPATPFFFAMRDRQTGSAAEDEGELGALARDNHGVRPSLLLRCGGDGDELIAELAYDGGRFLHATMEQLLRRYVLLLHGMARDPDQAISALPMMSDVERAALERMYRKPLPYPADMTIPRMFERRVAEAPRAIALVDGERQVTYEELARMAGATARRLRALGVERGTPVGICMQRSVDMVACLLAILEAGGAYVPFDPAYPAERLRLLREDAQVNVVLAHGELAWGDGAMRCLAPAAATDAPGPDAQPDAQVGPEDLAYLCYTSGTTGRPKAAMIPHRGVIRLLFGGDYVRLGAGETLMHMAPIAFDASTFEIWAALLHGGRCVLYPPEPPTGAGIARQIRAHGVTTMWLTAALFNAIVDDDPGHLRGLRQLLVGGEALSVAHVQRALAALPDTQIINGYGPTESTTFACCHRIPRALGNPASVPIGKPIGNTRVYILDDHQRPVPPGVPGEIYLGGAGLAHGYWRRPDLTRQAFVPNPFEPGATARMYATGDRARMLADGSIEFLGRTDFQVKLRGFRIELGEIEAVLREHPGVRDAVAAVRANRIGQDVLVAYVLADADIALSDLERDLGRKLPGYMMPARLIRLDELHRTANGKLDMRALPAPDWSAAPAPDAAAPRSRTEGVVARVWQEVLQREHIGVDDSFLALGGHSLLAVQAIVRLREVVGADVPLRLVFEAGTVAELARAIDAHGSDAHGSDAHARGEAALRPVPRAGTLPLSFSQERVWFIQEMHKDSKAYNFQATMRFTGALEVGVLRRAIDEIVSRHESLRTTFEATDGKPHQIIHPPQPAAFRTEDLGHLTGQAQRDAVAAWLDRELSTPFALDRLPLVRWTLLRLGPDEHIMIQVEHHLVHDGWSFHVFLSELTALYRAFAAGAPSPLAPLPIQFADYACWQRAWMQGALARQQLAYWRDQLDGAPPIWELPLDRARPAKQSMQGKVLRLEMAPALAEAARDLARRESATLFQVMLAVHLCLLYRYTGQEDLCVGTGVANRNRRELEGLIGMVINTIALRTDVSGDPLFTELLARVKQVTRAGYANQDVPFDQVVDVLDTKRSLAYSPIYQTTFSFHDAPMPDLDLPGLTLEIQEGLSNGSAKFDLNVIMMPRAEQNIRRAHGTGARGITMLWEYSTDILAGETVQRMVRHYQTLLAALVANPNQRISAAPLLDGDERRALLAAYDRTRAPLAGDRLVHELVADHARRTPAAPALCDGARVLTYDTLNRRANQLAHHLRGQSIGCEDMVALCMDHSAERVIAQLAVLKAGAAFVPMDPRHPRERLAWMLADCGARMLLTRTEDAAQVPDDVIPVLQLDARWAQVAGQPEHDPAQDVDRRHVAYAIFTSGSTGRPKGVLIEHHSLLALVRWHLDAFGVTAGDTGALLAGPAFDASVWELWPCLAAGARAVVAPPAVRTSPEALRDWLVASGVTVTFAPTPMAERMVALPWPERAPLRMLLTGGDKLHHHPARPLPFTLINNYGLTENTVVATSGPVPVAGEARRVPTIGKPIANTGVYILDQHLEPVPVGVPGEIFIGGAGVARGYANQPAMTAARFVCDPFSGQAGARMYRTGDRGRWLPNGEIEFLGRMDDQVQIRGLRVELGEINAALGRHPEVLAAATVVQQRETADPLLVAHVVARQALPARELRELLGRWLPAYMIPSQFVFLDELPMTANGKLDVSRLPRPQDPDGPAQPSFQAPRTALEEAVARIWSEVLGRPQVGMHDDFFEIGGHSLVAAQIIARINQRLPASLSLQALFDAPTVAALCALIESTGDGAAAQTPIQHEASPDEMLARLDELSEDEVEALLHQMKNERAQT